MRRRYELAVAYVDAVSRSGGVPIVLPHQPQHAAAYALRCDGLMLTGGDDPAMEPFGEVTDPRARVIDPQRQAFELALLAAAVQRSEVAVLGICLGMQLMALAAGGRLDQYMPDHLPGACDHQDDRRHAVIAEASDSAVAHLMGRPRGGDGSMVISSHRQAVTDPGRLRCIARSPDGVIEAVDDPARPFYIGVQWHPERGGDEPLSLGLIGAFVRAARNARSTAPRR